MLRREIRNYPSHIFLSSKMGVLNVQRCKIKMKELEYEFERCLISEDFMKQLQFNEFGRYH